MTLLDELLAESDELLGPSDADLAARFPGDRGVRQPVHTVYVPADRYTADLPARWGTSALDLLTEHAPDPAALAEIMGLDAALADQVYTKVRAKLGSEPIEDLRIDFEDGFGVRDDEDEIAGSAAHILLDALEKGCAPPFFGIRCKNLEPPTRRRGVTTLQLFMTALGRIPDGFVLTLPKVTALAQVRAMVAICRRLEQSAGWVEGSLRFEIQIETPQSVLGPDGTALVAPMIQVAEGRCTALHYGTYDYSASLGIAAEYQSMEHPAADHAKAVMQVAAAGTGVHLSDGSTNILPVGDAAAITAAWRLHARLVRRSLERGYYQGWDLHEAQLPSRYAAVYAFYLSGLPSAIQRLRAYTARTASGFLDEPATAVALAGFTLRAVECGAVSLDEVVTGTGVETAELYRLARRRSPAAAAPS